MMRDNIPEAHGAFPVGSRILRKKAAVCYFVYIFQGFANGNELHTNTIQLFHAGWRICEIVYSMDLFRTAFYFPEGFVKLPEYGQHKVLIKHKPPLFLCVL